MPVKTHIRLRRDISSTWTSVNPTLLSGEIAYETDTGKIKVGDGSTLWNALPYIQVNINGAYVPIGGISTAVTNTVTAAAGTLTGSTLASGVTASSLTSVGTLSSLTIGGNITGTGNLTLSSSGTNANITVAATGTGTAFFDSSSTGTVAISNTAAITTIGVGSTANTINIGTGTGASRTINVGTGASAKTINIGNTNTTSSLVLRSGSGGITIEDGGGDFVINNLTGYLYANGSSAVTAATTVPTTAMPSGSIINVQSVVVSTSTASTSSTTPTNISGLTVTLTPRSTSSKFLLSCMINTGYSSSTGGWVYHNFARSGTNLVFSSGGTANTFADTRHGDNGSMLTTHFQYTDSPATTSSITYTVRWSVYSGHTAYLNRRGVDAYFQGSSTFTVMEIA